MFTTNTPVAPARENCFDLLRLLLAGLVVYSHVFVIGGFGEEGFSRWARGQTIAGSVGVLGFFGLSGFLVGDSFIRDPSWWRFLRRRVRRILPGYWGCLLVTAAVIAPMMYRLQHGDLASFRWTGPGGAINFFLHNFCLQIRQWSIGDIVAGSAYPGSLNGSLWSLFPEFCCYLVLTFAGACGMLLGANRLWLAVFTVLLAVFHVLRVASIPLPVDTLPTLLALTSLTPYVLAFFVGVLCRAFGERVPLGIGGAVFFGLIALVLLRLGGYVLAAPIVVPVFLLCLGKSFSVRLRHDFSYGLYVYAFPCQQFLALMPWAHRSATVFLLASLALTILFAAVSWFGLERHFLSHARNEPLRMQNASKAN